MHWIADRRRENLSQHRQYPGHSAGTVRLMPFCSDAGGQSLIEVKTVASLAMHPVAEKTSGVNEECSISLGLM